MGLSGDGGETLHYQSVVDSRADPDDACVAEGFFDLANAAVVRYSVGGDAPRRERRRRRERPDPAWS